ncbi:hypothetical protein GCM10009764_17100 [Nocardia ninae]|uniref:Uncharacterized protein n=1 Tax=Nocardia ninae NBRC 108245 TaxID=1210091 RepID=A0A511M9F8_9NOCA|nr:hypothetical protein NN4_18020 [Nocardia ninae NBRC 108245]
MYQIVVDLLTERGGHGYRADESGADDDPADLRKESGGEVAGVSVIGASGGWGFRQRQLVHEKSLD